MYMCICVYRERNVRGRVGILCGDCDCDGDGNRSTMKPRKEREREKEKQWWCLCVTDGARTQPTRRGKLDWEN